MAGVKGKGRRAVNPLTRFWANVETGRGCWLWSAGKDKDGYGQFWDGKRRTRAHIFSYEAHRGPVPEGALVCHTCDNPSCVRPDHLFVGTNTDNMRDMVSKGRGARRPGEANPMARLTAEQVAYVRAGCKVRGDQRRIARELGVSPATINLIVRERTWIH